MPFLPMPVIRLPDGAQKQFNAPVTVTSIEVLGPDGASLLKIDGEQVAKYTIPAFSGPPTAVVAPPPNRRLPRALRPPRSGCQ